MAAVIAPSSLIYCSIDFSELNLRQRTVRASSARSLQGRKHLQKFIKTITAHVRTFHQDALTLVIPAYKCGRKLVMSNDCNSVKMSAQTKLGLNS